LTYLVHPAKTVIVKNGELSKLTVSVDGKPISSDLTGATVAFWNAGNEAIRPSHVLRPLVLWTDPPVPIVEVTIRKTSRAVVNPVVRRESREGHDRVAISWDILEADDGVLLQVIFAGSVDTNLVAEATLEGQREIKRLQSKSFRSAEEEHATRVRFWAITMALLTIVILALTLSRRYLWRKPVLVVVFSMTVIATVSIVRAIFPPVPPFGF
jgi:hypothetical protein